jgi:hypothetical protein
MPQIEELTGHKAALQQWIATLQQDFDYNLELLDGRDAELTHHEEHARKQSDEIVRLSAQNEELMQQLLLAQQSEPPPPSYPICTQTETHSRISPGSASIWRG